MSIRRQKKGPKGKIPSIPDDGKGFGERLDDKAEEKKAETGRGCPLPHTESLPSGEGSTM